MSVLYIDRSSKRQSVALSDASGVKTAEFGDMDPRSGGWAASLQRFIGENRIETIVVGTGPGSFAGIRSALAFALGYAAGTGCRVCGIPSPCALASPGVRLAVAGDARRGKRWIALFDGFRLERPVFQVAADALASAIPDGYAVVTPDAQRIGGELSSIFGERCLGERLPSAGGLAMAATANPSLLESNPAPIYLNPAVREA